MKKKRCDTWLGLHLQKMFALRTHRVFTQLNERDVNMSNIDRLFMLLYVCPLRFFFFSVAHKQQIVCAETENELAKIRGIPPDSHREWKSSFWRNFRSSQVPLKVKLCWSERQIHWSSAEKWLSHYLCAPPGGANHHLTYFAHLFRSVMSRCSSCWCTLPFSLYQMTVWCLPVMSIEHNRCRTPNRCSNWTSSQMVRSFLTSF